MGRFSTPVDIANVACDACGVSFIDPVQGFTENSKQSGIFGRIYDQTRRAELRRNIWRFAIKRAVLRPLDTNTMLLKPAMWVESTTYFVGSLVTDEGGVVWVSNAPQNIGNQPAQSLMWDQYYGPLTAMLYDSTLGYETGEIVYTTAGDGTYRVFMSLQSGNSDNPATATAWAATVTYFKDQVVTYLGTPYLSLIDLNVNQTPSASAASFNPATTYAINALVTGSDGVTYKSLSNGNLAHDPTSDGGVHWQSQNFLTPWTSVFVGGHGSLKWRQIGGAEFPNGVGLATLNIIYPVGAGPSEQSSSRNVYRLPANHLRRAPLDPKAGSNSIFGAPTNRPYTDWNFEGNYLTMSGSDAIPYRFVADTVDVNEMDDMFCEGLGLRMGMIGCEPLTQSLEQVKVVASMYKEFMGEARTVNAIEVGSEEPPLDDFLACRA